MVNLSTKDFPGTRIRNFTVSTGLNSGTTGKAFYNYRGGGLDFLGIDDGTRGLPEAVDRIAGNRKISPKSFITHQGFSADTLALLGQAFSKTWGRRKGRGFPATSFAGTYGNEFTVFDRPLGLMGSFSHSRGQVTTEGDDNFFKSDGGILKAETSYHTTTSTTTVLWGALANGSYRLNDFHTVSVRGMYNRSAEDETRFYEGDDGDWSVRIRNTRLNYVERGLFAGSISSSSFLAPLGGATLDMRFSYSRATRNEPDRREYTYEEDFVEDHNVWVLTQRSLDHGLTRMFGKMSEDERGPEINITFPFKQWGRPTPGPKAGVAYKNKDRDSAWRRFAFRPPSFSNAELDSLLSQSPVIHYWPIL